MLAEAPPGGPDAGVRSHADAIARALVERAVRGDVAAAEEIADRTEGKARQAIRVSYTEREKLEVAVRHLMEEAGCPRGEAIRALGVFRPEALELLDED